ncbi:hypothetical protein EDD15DRAFT_2197142 [Pisolithus albus]|nr:hypothetical protein EDD15DRAFT_2197142 [Pisolithus albus]
MFSHVLKKKNEKDGGMTYAHRETDVPLSIQVREQGERAMIQRRLGRAARCLASNLDSPPDPDTTYEFQLKGAGRTPFSWSADDVAVRRSSIREYLCSEAMHVLGIPTTRSPEMPVTRERLEKECVMTTVAETFIPIGIVPDSPGMIACVAKHGGMMRERGRKHVMELLQPIQGKS